MIKIGIIGAGPNGTGNAKNLAADARCKIAAVADPVEAAGKQLAELHSGAQVFTTIEAMLPHVDAVVISSPNWLHPEQTIQCAEAGKHVWIEKPMALTVEDGERMADVINRAGVASMVGFSVRFGWNSQLMKQKMEAGELGEWFSLCSRRNCMLKGLAGWRGDHSKSGGVMSELIIHEIDWAVNLVGFPKAVFCRKRSRLQDPTLDPRTNDHVWIDLLYDGERNVTIEGSQCSPIADYYKVIIGTEGSMHTRRWGQELYIQKGQEKDQQLPKCDGFNKHAHWLDVIEGKCESVADVNYGLKITKLIDTALESAVTGTVQDLDL